MIFEWRTYSFAPGAAATYLSAFQHEGLHLVTRHLPMLGYWMVECGRLNVLHHLWAYDDLDDRAARRTALAADTDWSSGFGPRAFPMIERQESLFLALRRGSPLLSEVLATVERPREAVIDGPLLATSWAMLEIAEDEPVGPPSTEAVGVWQVIVGRRPASYLGVFRSEAAVDIDPETRPALLREIIKPADFSPIR